MAGVLNRALEIMKGVLIGSYFLTNTGSGLIAIGKSGLTFVATQTVLGSEFDRNIVDTIDLSVTSEITFTSNWNPVEISGLIFREYGLLELGSRFLTRNVLTGSEIFDGEAELQIQQTIKFFN